MATVIMQHLEATEGLLQTVPAQNRDMVARQQAQIIINLLQVYPLFVSEASPLVMQMETVSWPTDVKIRLLAAFDAACDLRKLQDYTAFVYYIKGVIWQAILSQDINLRIQLQDGIRMMVGVLGLRNPTEGTVAALTAMQLLVVHGMDTASLLPARMKHAAFTMEKKKLKVVVKGLGKPARRFVTLPENVQDFRATDPRIYDRVFGTAPPVYPLPIDLARFNALVDSIPQRGSHTALKDESALCDNSSMGMVMMKMMQQASRAQKCVGDIDIDYAGQRGRREDQLGIREHLGDKSNTPSRPPTLGGNGGGKDWKGFAPIAPLAEPRKATEKADITSKDLGYKKPISVEQATDVILKDLDYRKRTTGKPATSAVQANKQEPAKVPATTEKPATLSVHAKTQEPAKVPAKANKLKKKRKQKRKHPHPVSDTTPLVKVHEPLTVTPKSKGGAATAALNAKAKKVAATETPDKVTSGKKKANSDSISVEKSRSQIRCRSSSGGSFSIKYDGEESQSVALAKAKAWLAAQQTQ